MASGRRPTHEGLLPLAFAAAILSGAAPPLCAQGAGLGRSLSTLFDAPAGKSHRASSSSGDVASNADFIALASGAEIAIASLKGPGVITHMWINVQSDDPYAGRLVVLRAKWDGESGASIEVPIGDFFGVGFGLDGNVDTLPVRVTADGRARSCWWPMPFSSSAEVTIRNDSPRPIRMLQWAVDWSDTPCPANVRTFHAHFRASNRELAAHDHKVLDVRGRGHYVGTVLSIWSGEEGWPGEGDDRFYIDGEVTPSLQGTGLEDYFGDNWSFHLGTGPYGGVTLFEGTGPGARSTACRWHLQDPIPFEKSLVVAFERSGWVYRSDEWSVVTNRADAFSSVAFWYQEEPHSALTVLPPPSERLPFFEIRYEPEEKDVFKTLRVAEGALPPEVQAGNFWAYGGQVHFNPQDRDKAHLYLPFDVPSVHDFDFYLRCTKSPDGGSWQPYIDGAPMGAPIDLYATPGTSKEVVLGRLRMKPGNHELELRGSGKNVASSGYALGFDSFMVRWYP
jgi:hypothetical protein